MLTSVQQLSGTTLRNTVITENINEILALVNKLILRENTIGSNKIVFDLPIVFRNITFSPDIAQSIIYFSVIKELEKKGYTVKINRTNEKPVLLIKWNSGINDDEINSMKKYLQEHSI
tara:strand:- start:1502 stop:1855 length:354 start_codon:yes stop_codon:yes gene_type:complete